MAHQAPGRRASGGSLWSAAMMVDLQDRLSPPAPAAHNGRYEASFAGQAADADWAKVCRQYAAGCTLAAMAISLLAIIGWLTDWLVLAGGFGHNVPMAPAAALTFLFLGTA